MDIRDYVKPTLQVVAVFQSDVICSSTVECNPDFEECPTTSVDQLTVGPDLGPTA